MIQIIITYNNSFCKKGENNRNFSFLVGHEHLDEFDIINMNGRLYNPTLGRFLSPDPYVQESNNSQNYNRYSYCLNNPLKYTDPDGEWFLSLFCPALVIVDAALWSATIDLCIQLASNGGDFQQVNWAQTTGAFVAGGIGGAIGFAAPAFTQANLFVRYGTKALYAGLTAAAGTAGGMFTTDLLDNGCLDYELEDYGKAMGVAASIAIAGSLVGSAYDYFTWDKYSTSEKIAMLEKEFDTKIQYAKLLEGEYAHYDPLFQTLEISDLGLSHKSTARISINHELVHDRDYYKYVASRFNPDSPKKFTYRSEANAYKTDMRSINKYKGSLAEWKDAAIQAKKYRSYEGNSNSFKVLMLLRNVW